MAYALYLQYGLDLEPCPLCVLQRACVIAMGVVFLVATFQNPRRAGATVYALLQLVIGGAGAVLATRQLWLQSLPKDQVPACGMSLNYMLDTLPFTDVLKKVFEGSGECAEKGWEFLRLSIAGWTLVFFVAMIAVSFALARRLKRRPSPPPSRRFVSTDRASKPPVSGTIASIIFAEPVTTDDAVRWLTFAGLDRVGSGARRLLQRVLLVLLGWAVFAYLVVPRIWQAYSPHHADYADVARVSVTCKHHQGRCSSCPDRFREQRDPLHDLVGLVSGGSDNLQDERENCCGFLSSRRPDGGTPVSDLFSSPARQSRV